MKRNGLTFLPFPNPIEPRACYGGRPRTGGSIFTITNEGAAMGGSADCEMTVIKVARSGGTLGEDPAPKPKARALTDDVKLMIASLSVGDHERSTRLRSKAKSKENWAGERRRTVLQHDEKRQSFLSKECGL